MKTDAEKMFEMAVRLVEANIRAGQSRCTNNFEVVVNDQVTAAFMALDRVWSNLNRDDDSVH